jgi:hypothetical protein
MALNKQPGTLLRRQVNGFSKKKKNKACYTPAGLKESYLFLFL